MKRLPTILSLVAIIIAAAALFLSLKRPRIGYVRSQQLVYSYLGMKEAQSAYQSKQQRWESELDTLTSDYRLAVSRFNADVSKLGAQEKESRVAELRKQKEYLDKHSWELKNQAKEEDDKLTEGVLNQINTFVTEYGKQHDYDIIFGTTQSGSLLYGASGYDITDQVLAALNAGYKGSSNAKH